MENNIHFYVSCTESFKRHLEHGVWIDATLELEDMQQEINRMLSTSLYADHTHWRITAFDTPLAYDFLSDQSQLKHLHDMAMLIELHGDMAAKLLARFHGDIIETQDAMKARYIGFFEDEIAFVTHQLTEEGYRLEGIKPAIDYQVIWDLWHTRFFSLPAKGGGIYVLHR